MITESQLAALITETIETYEQLQERARLAGKRTNVARKQWALDATIAMLTVANNSVIVSV